MKRLEFISMAMILLLSAGAARAATITVTNTNDAGAGSLREAIATAASGDTLNFGAGVTGAIVLTSGELGIDKDLTISGPGITKLAVDGNASSRVLVVSSGKTVNLAGLTVRNGKPTVGNGGGGIDNRGTLTLSKVTVSGNTVIGNDGAGIYNIQGAVLTITDSVITGNTTTTHNGGGIYNQGTLTMTNSTLSANTAKYYGGGIVNGGTVTLTHVTLTENQSDYSGGGISNWGTVTMTESVINGNTALNNFGGGITNEANEANLHLSNVIIRNNSSGFWGGGLGGAGNITLSHVVITDNTSALGCGGAVISGGTLTIEDSIVARNTAPNGPAGGICTVYGGTLNASNIVVNHNSALDRGGALYNCPICTITLSNVTISGNATQSGGGGIWNETGGTLSLTNVTVTQNSGTGGGGIFHYPSAAPFTLINTILADNTPGNCNGILTYVGGNNLSSDTTCGFTGPGDLSNTDPLLGPLASNGGFSETHALQFGSPAIDAADAVHAPAEDQRGVPRPYGVGPDMGAYEYTPVNPIEGTYGTKIAIAGSGFGPKKGKVSIGSTSPKILDWADGLIHCSLVKALPPGMYNLTVKPQQRGSAPFTVTNGFSSMGPEIIMPGHNHGSIGSEITVPGNFFGTKKGKVTLGGKSCKVTKWTMDTASGEGEIKFVIPKGLSSQSHELKVVNDAGTDAISFTVD